MVITIPSKIPIGARCAKCGEDDFRVVKEYNHIFGRANSDIVTLECLNCHAKLTYDQNQIPPKARKHTASKRNRDNFVLISIGSQLEIMGKQLKKMGMEDYGDSS